MTLREQIANLREESLRALDASHNYYVHTGSAWRLIQRLVKQGHKFTVSNQATGSTIGEAELSGLAQGYITGYLASATFQDFVAIFERFFFEVVKAWLIKYPGNLAGKELKFRIVLDSASTEDTVAAVVAREVHGLSYQRVPKWFEELEKLVKLGCPNQDEIARLAEIKASRDVLVHNNGVANSIYIDKSMGLARFASGEKLELPERYHRESWGLIKQVVSDISDAAIRKLKI